MRNAKKPRLTIGMATYDDFDGVYFTITSLLIHHREAMEAVEIVVVDNNPESMHGKQVRKWIEAHVPNGRYIPFTSGFGTAQARDEIFRQAAGDRVLCLDCHVLLETGVVARLMRYDRQRPESPDLLVGPLLYDSGKLAATHQEPQWRNGAWGIWSIDDRGRDPENEPFEVWQQGMGLFSCRRSDWVGFHPEFRGFGGCESYIMEKFRRMGGRVLCCPWLRWTHRFSRPSGIPYRVSRTDSLRNYLIGFAELGIDSAPLLEHYRSLKVKIPKASTASARRNDELCVVGNESLGSVRMRGLPVSSHCGCSLLSPQQIPEAFKSRIVFAVKNGISSSIRRSCERLIYDPLDAFSFDRKKIPAIDYWRLKYREFAFDDILATSPACYEVMREALPEKVRVHLVPHHADPTINRRWYDKQGPVVYVGLNRYIRSRIEEIRAACDLVGKPFVEGDSLETLNGASLALALRLPPFDDELNQICKPQVKIANAVAAGIPVVSTDCSAAVSLYPGIPTVSQQFDRHELKSVIRQTLARVPREQVEYTLSDYLSAVDKILGRDTRVVYTAIFGGRDELRDPEERTPGVQYICFTDNPHFRSNIWQVRYVPPSKDPLMQAKRYKICAHEVLDCSHSLWIDGRVQLKSLNGVFEWMEADLAFRAHENRRCIYQEAEHCKKIRKGNPRLIDEAVGRYRAEGHPRDFGLWYGGIVLRKHTVATRQFNEQWWREVETGSSRDQLSLPVVIRKCKASVATLPGHLPQTKLGRHTSYSDAPMRSLA